MEHGMQFMAALFGADSPALNAGFALGIVLVLIVLSAWVLKLFTRAGNSVARGRHKRLSVVDSAVVDAKRKVVIIRRDNVEHVIMTGGPTDLVIESGVPAPDPVPPRRAAPVRPTRPAARPVPPVDAKPPAAHPAHPVARESIDRLNELIRPAPLKPAPPTPPTHWDRHRHPGLISTGPHLRVDNSAGPSPDSAKTEPVDGTDGRPRFVRSRFLRSIPRNQN
jgi:flagellar biogenesis protein FliO